MNKNIRYYNESIKTNWVGINELSFNIHFLKFVQLTVEDKFSYTFNSLCKFLFIWFKVWPLQRKPLHFVLQTSLTRQSVSIFKCFEDKIKFKVTFRKPQSLVRLQDRVYCLDTLLQWTTIQMSYFYVNIIIGFRLKEKPSKFYEILTCGNKVFWHLYFLRIKSGGSNDHSIPHNTTLTISKYV